MNAATLTITDDDTAPSTVTLSVDNATVVESARTSAATVTATLDHPAQPGGVTVTLTAGGTATGGGVDYTLSSTTIAIAEGATEGAATLDIVQDVIDDDGETIELSATVSGGLTVEGSPVTVTITDDDTAPSTVTLSVDNATVSESAGTSAATVTATLDHPAQPGGVTVTLTAGGTATGGGVDYTLSSTTIAIAEGATEGAATLDIVQDVIDDDGETIELSATVSGGLTVEGSPVTVTITDDDAATAVSLRLDPATVTEGGGAQTVTVHADVQGGTTYADATEVTVSVSAGTATLTTDYAITTAAGTITIPAGGTTASTTFAITPVSDTLVETGGETVTVEGSSGSLTVNAATLTITDDDAAPVISIAAQSVSEGAGSATLTVTRTGDLSGSSSAGYAFSDGTATGSGTDYTGTAGTVSFAANANSATLPVTIVQDTIDEGTGETFTVTLSSPGGATLGTASATITITDDDTARLAFADDVTVAEDAGEAVFTVELSPASAQKVTVNVLIGQGSDTAVVGVDYTVPSSSLTFDPGETEQEIRVSILDDEEVEGTETFTIILSNPSNAELGDDTAVGTITDPRSDSPTAPSNERSLTVADVEVTEDADEAVFTVELSPASEQTVTVDHATSNGTATAGVDYTPTSGSLTFDPGETEQEIKVSIMDDNIQEADETFTVTLSNPVGAALDPNGASATSTITDDDAAPTAVSLRLVPAAVTEGGGAQTVTVHADVQGSTTFGSATEVTVSVSAGTATATTDYAITTAPGTITIAAGGATASTTFEITPVSDTLVETGGETVTVGGESGSLRVNRPH